MKCRGTGQGSAAHSMVCRVSGPVSIHLLCNGRCSKQEQCRFVDNFSTYNYLLSNCFARFTLFYIVFVSFYIFQFQYKKENYENIISFLDDSFETNSFQPNNFNYLNLIHFYLYFHTVSLAGSALPFLLTNIRALKMN